jgi:hypothetical protein
MTAKWAVRVPLILLATVFGVTGIIFVIAGGLTGNWYRAWDVISGTSSPFKGSYPEIFLILSVLGYLLVPATIGIYIVDAVSRFISRRVKTLKDATDNIEVRLSAFQAIADGLPKDPI